MTDDFLKALAAHDTYGHIYVARHHRFPDAACGWQAPADWVSSSSRVMAFNETGNDLWVAVNAYPDAVTSREQGNIAAYRAHYVEIDVPGAPAPCISVGPPSIVVESSPGKRHYYWLLEGAPRPAQYVEYDAVQRALVHAVPHSDHAACDPARVLRLPGTINWGYSELPTARVLELHPDRRYSAADFLAAFPGARAAVRPHLPPVARQPSTLDRFARYLEAAGAPPSPGQGRNPWVYRMAAVGCRDMGLGAEEVAERVHAHMLEAQGAAAYDYEEVERIVLNAARFAHGGPAPITPEVLLCD